MRSLPVGGDYGADGAEPGRPRGGGGGVTRGTGGADLVAAGCGRVLLALPPLADERGELLAPLLAALLLDDARVVEPLPALTLDPRLPALLGGAYWRGGCAAGAAGADERGALLWALRWAAVWRVLAA